MKGRSLFFFFFSSRRRHTRLTCDWSSDVCSSDLLSRPIEDGLARAEPFCDLPTEERPDDWVREIVVLKHMAWMLPALESSAQATDDAEFQQRVAAHLDALLSLEERRVTAQRGLEASLAQGFKVAARLQPHLEVDSRALLLLDRAAFWYSQINLVHAIAARLAPGRDP